MHLFNLYLIYIVTTLTHLLNIKLDRLLMNHELEYDKYN